MNHSRFARHTEILPYTVQTAINFLPLDRSPKFKGAMMGGKFQVYSVSKHRSRAGVKYNRLLRFRRRVLL